MDIDRNIDIFSTGVSCTLGGSFFRRRKFPGDPVDLRGRFVSVS